MYKPDPKKTYIVSISGGKDSTALWLYLKYELMLPNIVVVFCDTGWEHQITYDYLECLKREIGDFTILYPELNFVDLAIKKKRFPSAKARFCTTELKLKPMKNWLLKSMMVGDFKEDDVILVSGVRAEESPSRAKMDEFSEKDDYYNLPHWRPILKWTWQDVFACHERNNIKPNPLYAMGMGRVGCMPCVMSNKAELKEIALRLPDVFEKVEASEKRMALEYPKRPSSFWHHSYVPDRFCSREWVKEETGEKFKIPTAIDVKNYVLLEKEEKKFGGKMTSLFDDEEVPSCKSIYGLCE